MPNFVIKVAKAFSVLLGNFKITSFNQNRCGYFLANFWKMCASYIAICGHTAGKLHFYITSISVFI